MAEMSHAEKRAAGWRKLKKFQQHKNSPNSGKSTRKKTQRDGSRKDDNMNEDSISYFTGFSDDNKNGGDNCSNASSTVQHVDSPDLSSSEESNFSKQLPQRSSEKEASERTVYQNLPEGTLPVSAQDIFKQTSKSAIQESIPVATNIFSNSVSSGATNYSDFFDSLKPAMNKEPENVSISRDTTSGPANAPLFTQFQTEQKLPHTETVKPFIDYLLPRNQIKVFPPDDNENLSDLSVIKSDEESSPGGSEVMGNGGAAPAVTEDPAKVLISSTESLRQLSLEINGLMRNESTSGPPSRELERRNQELAALLAQEQQRSEEFQLQLKEYQSRASQLEVELAQAQEGVQVRTQKEMVALQEQLQVHVQTIGILVGEKAELEAAVSMNQLLTKQKAEEVEELQGRLKASRHRVTDLERELSSLSGNSKQLESTAQQQAQALETLRSEREALQQRLEETEEEAAELRQGVHLHSSQAQRLQQELKEKQTQLDLTQLRVQQLSSSDGGDAEGQLELVQKQKLELEQQVGELQQKVQALSNERDQANAQYQEYLQHVNNQMKSMSEKMAATTAENEELLNREMSLVKHLSELERQLQQQQLQQQQQQQQRNKAKDSPTHAANMEHIKELEKSLATLQEEKESLSVQVEKQLQENKAMQEQLEEYRSKVEELEVTVETLKADQPDASKLLAAMESDKVAAARAVAQNQKLKTQLEELQEGFIQMSNSKLELAEQVQREQHLCKELGERLAQQEMEISDLKTELQESRYIVEKLRKDSSEQMSKQVFQQNQIADQMRHYEAQGHLADVLQNELHQKKELCDSLRSENNDLRMQLAQASLPAPESTSSSAEHGGSHRDELVDSLSASVRQLEMERDQLLAQLNEFKEKGKTSQEHSPLCVSEGTDAPDSAVSGSDVDKAEYFNMKEAMERLQERFTKTMEDVAELSDEKQRLEHLVLQLQSETETIGEYIALYQVQRSILRQRAQEKDEQLARLARDREEVKIKLNELNRLIGELVTPAMAASSAQGKSHDSSLQLSEGLINGDVTMKHEGATENDQEREIHAQSGNNKVDTAGKIIALLSEIETSTLVEPRNMETFHPCPWCSGRLITV